MKKNILYLITILLLLIGIIYLGIKLSKINDELGNVNDDVQKQSNELKSLILENNNLRDEIGYLVSEIKEKNKHLNYYQNKEIANRNKIKERENNTLTYKTLYKLTVYQSKNKSSNILGNIPKNTILTFSKSMINLNQGQLTKWLQINYEGVRGYIISEYYGNSLNNSGLTQNLLIVKG